MELLSLRSLGGLAALSCVVLAYPAPGDGDESPQSSPTFVPGPTVIPAVHWEHPVDDINNLTPTNGSTLYYTGTGVADPGVQHLYAAVNGTFQYPTVILDHSSLVRAVECSPSSLKISFASQDSYQQAVSSWSALPQMVLATYNKGCGNSTEQRAFWLTNRISSSDAENSITAKVDRELDVQDALHGADLEWGTYYPPNSTSRFTNSTSGAATGGGVSSSANSTSEPTYGDFCGYAPPGGSYAFPVADCGDPDFDRTLDDAIGYRVFSDQANFASNIQSFLPGLSLDSEDLRADDAPLSRRGLIAKRGFFSWITRAWKIITTPVRLITQAIKKIPVVGNFIAKVTTLRPSLQAVADIDIGPKADDDSPWGKAALLYQVEKEGSKGRGKADLSLYCYNCGIKGHFVMAGRATWNILDGVKALEASLKAELQAGVNIGLVATVAYEHEKSKALVRYPVPDLGVAVKGVFSAGVYFSIDAKASINIEAQGQALVGVNMIIDDFQARLNLLYEDSAERSSISGYTPRFEKRFEFSATISAEAKLSLPIAINIGMEVPPLRFKRNLALINEPGVSAKLTAAASAGTDEPASETCNNGIEYSLNVYNDITLDIFGLTTLDLHHWEPSEPLIHDCKQFKSSGGTDLVVSADEKTSITPNPLDNTADDDTIFVGDFTEDPDNEEYLENSDGADAASTKAPTAPNGTVYRTLSEYHGEFQIVPGEDGNLYAVSPDSGSDDGAYLFATTGNGQIVVGDDQRRLLHFYPDFMEAYGVSRIRLSNMDQVPKTSDAIMLFPSNSTATGGARGAAYYAGDTNGGSYDLVWCTFEDASSRVFLAQDNAPHVLDVLADEEMRYLLTGAVVTECDYLALVTGPVAG